MASIPDLDEFFDALRTLQPEFPAAWPEAELFELANGSAVAISTEPGNDRGHELDGKALTKLLREPAVREELKRLLSLARQPRTEQAAPWRKVLFIEATAFSRQFRCAYLSPDDLRDTLVHIIMRAQMTCEAGGSLDRVDVHAPDRRPKLYVNPLTDRDLRFTVGPRRIVVDLTHATTNDLEALGKTLRDVRRRLGYRDLSGQPPKDNDEVMRFAHRARHHQLRATVAGRRRQTLPWHRVWNLTRNQFEIDDSDEALKAQYRKWKELSGQ